MTHVAEDSGLQMWHHNPVCETSKHLFIDLLRLQMKMEVTVFMNLGATFVKENSERRIHERHTRLQECVDLHRALYTGFIRLSLQLHLWLCSYLSAGSSTNNSPVWVHPLWVLGSRRFSGRSRSAESVCSKSCFLFPKWPNSVEKTPVCLSITSLACCYSFRFSYFLGATFPVIK